MLHAITPEIAGHDVHTPPELGLAHFAGMVSMIVVLLGVVVDGARRPGAPPVGAADLEGSVLMPIGDFVNNIPARSSC